jgi:hypothetical protein
MRAIRIATISSSDVPYSMPPIVAVMLGTWLADMAIITAIATTSALLILPVVHILVCWIAGIAVTSTMDVITPHVLASVMRRIMGDLVAVRHKAP